MREPLQPVKPRNALQPVNPKPVSLQPRNHTQSQTVEIEVTLDYVLPSPCMILMQIEATNDAVQTVLDAKLHIEGSPKTSVMAAHDGIGLRRWIEASRVLDCTYQAKVAVARKEPDIGSLKANSLNEISGNTTAYLFPSRYCPLDPFFSFVETTFGSVPSGAMVNDMAGWIAQNLTYDANATTPTTTAQETFTSRRGVCRDFSHVLIAFCRAASIPARIASVYGPDVNPQDFHAIVEVFLEGHWHMVDPTGMARSNNTVRLGIGRDATDIAFLTGFGAMQLRHQSVSVRQSAPIRAPEPTSC
ncbi:transglutaminase family protein [Pseudahrensia aquimaris]|uniref:Transglutaminase family protein n=1 Tax=Pseudahrensia aquimaris TaxID=744461 RepID=A0ABW3FBF9_9HYPH